MSKWSFRIHGLQIHIFFGNTVLIKAFLDGMIVMLINLKLFKLSMKKHHCMKVAYYVINSIPPQVETARNNISEITN